MRPENKAKSAQHSSSRTGEQAAGGAQTDTLSEVPSSYGRFMSVVVCVSCVVCRCLGPSVFLCFMLSARVSCVRVWWVSCVCVWLRDLRCAKHKTSGRVALIRDANRPSTSTTTGGLCLCLCPRRRLLLPRFQKQQGALYLRCTGAVCLCVYRRGVPLCLCLAMSGPCLCPLALRDVRKRASVPPCVHVHFAM